MKQMLISGDLIIKVNYGTPGSSRYFKELRPVVFREMGGYYCLLGPDLQEGILGTGDSPEEAVEDWERRLLKRLSVADEEDEVAVFIKDTLDASENEVW